VEEKMTTILDFKRHASITVDIPYCLSHFCC